MIDLPPPLYIEDPDELRSWLERIGQADVIAVDTEADSFHHYTEKVCLIQMSALGEDVIVDPLAFSDLEVLRPIFATPPPG